MDASIGDEITTHFHKQYDLDDDLELTRLWLQNDRHMTKKLQKIAGGFTI